MLGVWRHTSAAGAICILLGMAPTVQAQQAGTDELGVRVGSFVLFPTIEGFVGYDSNPFGQANGPRSSLVAGLRPTLSLRSDWNNHMLNLTAGGTFGFYPGSGASSFIDADVSADGRVDIMRDWYATGLAFFRRSHEPFRNAVGVAVSDDYSYYNAFGGDAGMYQKFNRFFYRINVNGTAYRYDTGLVVPAGQLQSASRDRVDFNETLRLGYEVLDGIDVYTQGGLNQRRYDRAVNEAGQNRDSQGWTIGGGATVDLGGISKIDGFAGYSRQSYDQAGFASVGTFVFGVSGVWNPYAPLFIKPLITRSINETGTVGYKGYTYTSVSVSAEYEVRNDITLSALAGYGRSEYQIAAGSASPARGDNIWRGSIEARYSFRPQFYVGASYEYLGISSNVAGGSSDRHVVLFKVGGRY